MRNRILIVGGIATGKKSLFNSLLCDKVLPLGMCFPNDLLQDDNHFYKIEYGDKKAVVITLKDKITDLMIEYASIKTLKHIVKYNFNAAPPLILNHMEYYEEMDHYHHQNNIKDYQKNPFREIKFIANNILLKNVSFYICDVYFTSHLQLLNISTNSDIILFVFDASRVLTNSEMELIAQFPKKKLFFVVNKMDQLENNEREQLIEFVNHKLSNYTSYPISYVSSFLALEAIKNSDVSLYQESGIPFIISNLMINMSKFRNMQ